jgi:nitrate reductase gamma subunit
MRLLLIFVTLLASFEPAHAYVGPGLGVGVIGAIFGVIFAVLLAIIGLFWYPIKRMFKKKEPEDNSLDSDQSGQE